MHIISRFLEQNNILTLIISLAKFISYRSLVLREYLHENFSSASSSSLTHTAPHDIELFSENSVASSRLINSHMNNNSLWMHIINLKTLTTQKSFKSPKLALIAEPIQY